MGEIEVNTDNNVEEPVRAETEPIQEAGTAAPGGEKPEAHAKKERKLRNVILIITAIIVVAIVAGTGIRVWNSHKAAVAESSPEALSKSYAQLQHVTNKPANATKQGGLRAYSKTKYNPKAPTVEVYEDFLCPYCGKLARELEPTLIRMENARQINLEFHVVNFLDTPQTKQYSTRTASAVAYVSAHDPDHTAAFVSALFERDFQPNENHYKDVSNDQIAAQAIKAGVKPDVANEAMNGMYADYITKATNYNSKRRELYTTVQGTHSFFTPTIRVDGHIWPVDVFSDLSHSSEQFCHSIGIDPSKVGDPNVLPAIGSDGVLSVIK
ncbi:thioredoxin domain-containing protein [Bifidobacterium sp. ESL0769]|uniref:DsbA family protein n=1 Tax=Bifidobacterium sp. ESL0769 TaxID=2983229 RepID=UPI0023F8133A|nr:thioredoxin domain-containing protein [Bifidobacterium sp. ESL0769]WEV66821.1 thioredoxin domain-containing protein [Bifidobacterium sp. ESL0769]